MSTMNKLPDRWDVKPLGEACKTIKGKKPKNSGPATTERTVPYINIKAFESGQSVEFAAPGNYPTCERDDVLIVWDGARAGLSGRAVPGYIGSTLAKVYSDVADNRYLFYFLQSQYGRINSRTKGVGIPHVDPTIFNNIPFPIAPPEQQKHIVAEIEKQFSRLDEAVANLKRVKANLKRYKAAVLKAAVEGKLTEEWRKAHPDVEPASGLVKRILAERCVKWEKQRGYDGKKKYVEPQIPDTSKQPDLPEGWVWTSIGHVFDVYVGATPSRSRPEYWNGDIPWVSSGEVGFCRIKSTRETISQEGYEYSSTHIHPVGTVLLGMIGEGKTRGQAAILDIRACNNQNAAAIHVSETEIFPEYVYSFLEKEYEVTRRRGSGGNQPALNKERVKQIPFPLPPLPEQAEIVAEVASRLSNLESLANTVEMDLARAERLRQKILQAAFSGYLVTAAIGSSRGRTKERLSGVGA